MTINTFDKTNLKQVRKDIDAALAQVAKTHGVNLSIGAISFQADTFTTKLTAVIANSKAGSIPGNAKWQRNFKIHTRFNTFTPSNDRLTTNDLGATFTFRGVKHTIVGAMGANAKGPAIILANPNGKFIRADEAMVARLVKAGV